jgi:hypothetical protein
MIKEKEEKCPEVFRLQGRGTGYIGSFDPSGKSKDISSSTQW